MNKEVIKTLAEMSKIYCANVQSCEDCCLYEICKKELYNKYLCNYSDDDIEDLIKYILEKEDGYYE